MSGKVRQRAAVIAVLTGLGVAVELVLRFPPARYSFYPRCPVYVYLHWQCPGCGATRAFAALLHGHPGAALHLNGLFVCLVPLLMGYAAWSCYRAWTMAHFVWPAVPVWTTYALLGLAVVFTVARNLPR